jgi:hypothetical protein
MPQFTPFLRYAGFGAIAGFVMFSMSPAQAADFSFRGSFERDDEVQLFNFTVGALSDVTLRTYSYAGGTQADGTVVPRGGFDPILALFDATGALIGQNDDGASPNVPVDPVTNRTYDTFLQVALAPGNYTVAVMQFNNFAVSPNLANGFTRQGQGNFTSTAFLASPNCGQPAFCDFTGNGRTNAWAFDILNVSAAVEVPIDPTDPTTPIPEPLTLGGTLLAFGGLVTARRRKAQRV